MKKERKKLSLPIKLGVIGIAHTVKLFAKTTKRKVVDHPGMLDTISERPCVLAFWHNRNFSMMTQSPKILAAHAKILVSESTDGDILATALKRFGIECVRGSSNKKGKDKGGARALVAMRKMLKTGGSVCLAVDGSQGPRYVAQDGALWLSATCQVPIMPITINWNRYWQMNNWDRTIIPKPFARCEYVIGEPVHVPKKPDEATLEEHRTKLHDALMAITVDRKP